MGKNLTWKNAHKASPYYKKLKKAGYYKKPRKPAKSAWQKQFEAERSKEERAREKARAEEAIAQAEARALVEQQRTIQKAAKRAAKKKEQAEQQQRVMLYIREQVLPRVAQAFKWSIAKVRSYIEQRRAAE